MKTLDTPSDRSMVATMKRRGVTGRLVHVPRLALMLDCSRQTALSISRRWDFPEPYDVLGDETGRPQDVWLREHVEAWIAENPDPVQRRKK